MRSIQRVFAAVAAPFESVTTTARQHRASTRLVLAAGALTAVLAVSSGGSLTQASPPEPSLQPASILPDVVGVGVRSDAGVSLTFAEPMDRASVEQGIQVHPEVDTSFGWSQDRRTLVLRPVTRWRTDTRYLVVVGESARSAEGRQLDGPRRFSFTTQTAPSVTDFEVAFAGVDEQAAQQLAEEGGDPLVEFEVLDSEPASLPPTEIAPDVSAATEVRVGFSAEMDRADTERVFAISPRVAGEITWDGNDLIFRPAERLVPGGRYTVSLVGAHDALGNPLAGKANFSFTVRDGAQVVRVRPRGGEVNVTAGQIEIWFSQPVDVQATAAAFRLRDATAGADVRGKLSWNERHSVLIFRPDSPLAAGHRFEVLVGDEARDADGNPVSVSSTFTTEPPVEPPVAAVPQPTPVPPTPTVAPPAPAVATPAPTVAAGPALPAPAPSGDLIQYALNQINSARAAYGRAPIALDPTMSAVAAAHAWDQVQYGYYSHASRDGSGPAQRQAAAGVGFSAIGENQCHHYAMNARDTLEWCHSAFMAEPYPGEWNHIANILDPRWTRVGIGIGDDGSHVVITWDFAN